MTKEISKVGIRQDNKLQLFYVMIIFVIVLSWYEPTSMLIVNAMFHYHKLQWIYFLHQLLSTNHLIFLLSISMWCSTLVHGWHLSFYRWISRQSFFVILFTGSFFKMSKSSVLSSEIMYWIVSITPRSGLIRCDWIFAFSNSNSIKIEWFSSSWKIRIFSLPSIAPLTKLSL